MPRRISKSSPKDFEPKVKNRFSLGSDSNIDNDFKAFKIGDIPTGLEFKLGSIRATADEFITSKETTEELTVTKIKGNRVGSQTEPQFLFQAPDETNPSAGLWFNCFGETGNLIRSAGTTGHLHLEADGAQYQYIGDDSGNSFQWMFGDAVSGTQIMSLEHEGEIKLYSTADSGDYFSIAIGSAGATTVTTVDDGGAAAHITVNPDGHVEFDSPAGFDQFTPTYNASDTEVNFKTDGNKAFVTFGSGNITDLNLNLPATSGNFVLLLKQDGTGSRTVTNYKAFDSGGAAANGSATVKFAGGSNPTLTTDANHVDILSFYWDADNEICYGVASLDFQF
tara:strand:- start:189 stop:1199 length:1011 start_codon:yes stop_codon:yes gene_type:complete